ncbi:hypothetical protein [Streptomyces sp. 184]|uniref:hypothetical protein n=1 Tax=Streptomyces sp. 184 TaxID=1827526 RepID=UPI003891EC17
MGPTLLRWLPPSLEDLSEPAAAHTVRTAALIGGEKALDLLAGYVGDERLEVVNELIKAWNYFDADAYADRVLCRLPLAGNLVAINHPGQMRAAARLRELTGAYVRYPLRGPKALADLPPLRVLWVDEVSEAADRSVLSGHPDLMDLTLSVTKALRGGAALADLIRLRWLTTRLPEDLDLSTLRDCRDLADISLSGVAEKDLSPLTTFAGLRYVDLSGSGRETLRGFDDLREMHGLRFLRLEGVDIDPWLRRVRNLPSTLTDVYLANCVVPPDPEVFLRFPNLKLLAVDACRTSDGTPVAAPYIPGTDVRIG